MTTGLFPFITTVSNERIKVLNIPYRLRCCQGVSIRLLIPFLFLNQNILASVNTHNFLPNKVDQVSYLLKFKMVIFLHLRACRFCTNQYNNQSINPF